MRPWGRTPPVRTPPSNVDTVGTVLVNWLGACLVVEQERALAEKGPYRREVGRGTVSGVRLRGRREGRPTATVTFSRKSLAGCRGQLRVSDQCTKNYDSKI